MGIQTMIHKNGVNLGLMPERNSYFYQVIIEIGLSLIQRMLLEKNMKMKKEELENLL